MSRLEFISDNDLKEAVGYLLEKSYESLKTAESKFYDNVIDPFAAVFEMAGFNLCKESWIDNEKTRQAQKSLTNNIGTFHQKILGKVNGWKDLSTGKVLDIISEERMILAEIKNKHNTVKGADLKGVYNDLDMLVMPKHSPFKGYTAYYVQIIPKNPKRFNLPFTPSDKTTGSKKPENALIRTIDGYSFYELVTGVEDALLKLFQSLPEVIEEINSPHARKCLDNEFFNQFFEKAFTEKPSQKKNKK